VDELARVTEKLASIDDPSSLLGSLFAYSPVAFEVYDAAGYCLVTNQAATELFGSSPPPGYNIFEDNVAEAAGLHPLIRRAFDGERVRLPPVWYDARELTNVSVDGKPVAIELTLFPLRDVHGTVRHVGLCHKDVTSEMELRKVEASLREAEESMSALLASMGDGVIATDTQAFVTRMNPVAEKLTGWSTSEAFARPIEEVVCLPREDDSEATQNPVREVLERGSTVELQHQASLRSRDGVVRSIAPSAAPIRARDGQLLGAVFVLRDVTERGRAERALRRSEARYRSLVESTAALVWALDANGQIVSTDSDEAWHAYTGQTAEEFRQRGFAPVLHPEDSARVLATWAASLHAERAMELEARLYHASSDSYRYVHARMAPVRDSGGVVREWIGTVVDIDDRRRAQDEVVRLEAEARQMAEASRLKSDFLASMSHELRTPLNAIIGFAELIEDGLVQPNSPRHEEFVGHILRSGRHLLQLIDDVLDLAKIEAGKLVLRPETVLLKDVVEEVCSIVSTSGLNAGVSLTTGFVEPALDALLDVGRFKQVLFNYVSNALKFTPSGGHVSVRVAPDVDGFFRLEVEDDGPGISEEDQATLFVDFHQLGKTPTPRQRGTGLGLALTKRLVEAQGGSVGVRSAEGVGSVFSAVLPRGLTSATTAEIEHASADGDVRRRMEQ
jgi:PAS domain S-box-containing protein